MFHNSSLILFLSNRWAFFISAIIEWFCIYFSSIDDKKEIYEDYILFSSKEIEW